VRETDATLIGSSYQLVDIKFYQYSRLLRNVTQNSGMVLFHDDVNESATVNATTKERRVRGTLITYLLTYSDFTNN
jgi:hypothetical protein